MVIGELSGFSRNRGNPPSTGDAPQLLLAREHGRLRRWVVLNADNRAFPFELSHQLLEVVGCSNREVWDEGCFRSIGRGHDQGSGALLSG